MHNFAYLFHCIFGHYADAII